MRNLKYNYGAPLWTIFGCELSECRCDVELLVRCFRLWSSKIDVSTFKDRGSMCRPSKIDDRCVNLRRSMCRLSKIDDRCVDLRGSMIDVSTFEDGWSMCQPLKIDGHCVDLRRPMIMWNYVATLAQNIDGIVVCKLRRGFALQCFHLFCDDVVHSMVCWCPIYFFVLLFSDCGSNAISTPALFRLPLQSFILKHLMQAILLRVQ